MRAVRFGRNGTGTVIVRPRIGVPGRLGEYRRGILLYSNR